MKKIYEIYHTVMILGFSLLLNFIVIGLFIALPLVYFMSKTECPF